MLAELLRAIDEAPDEVDRWHPLADWFMDNDDPRGELIAIDLALEDKPSLSKRAELGARRTELLATSTPKLLGDTFAQVVAEGYGTITWRRGFVESLEYKGSSSMPHRRPVGWLVKLITAEHVPFTLVREIDFSYTDLSDLTPFTRFQHLRKLKITGCALSAEQCALHSKNDW